MLSILINYSLIDSFVYLLIHTPRAATANSHLETSRNFHIGDNCLETNSRLFLKLDWLRCCCCFGACVLCWRRRHDNKMNSDRRAICQRESRATPQRAVIHTANEPTDSGRLFAGRGKGGLRADEGTARPINISLLRASVRQTNLISHTFATSRRRRHVFPETTCLRRR